MFHFVVMFISWFLGLLSFYNPFLPETVRNALLCVGFIACIRFMIEQDEKIGKKILEKANELENSGKIDANVGVGVCIYRFEEEHELFPGYQDYLIRLENGSEIVLSTKNPEFKKMIEETKGKLKYYYKGRFIVCVEEIEENCSEK